MIITHINEYFNKIIVQSTKITIDKDCTEYYYKNVQSTKKGVIKVGRKKIPAFRRRRKSRNRKERQG